MTSAQSTVRCTRHDSIATLGIDRPHKLNALDYPTIDAHRAAGLGLVNRVVPAGELLDHARELAERVIRHPATAVTACLNAVTRGINLPIDEALAVEAAQFATTLPTQGVTDGLARFLNRH
ncbi:enoyl-CoA hydratase-related protein [Streptomyces sp. NPDC006510]|uniref:enoyl-CoA hydratase-related protein n=1 Tax=Streptomyces sp. NPDC006510 TaxID=3155600 RepID=UPI0033A92530